MIDEMNLPQNMPQDLISINDFADILHTSTGKIRTLVDAGVITIEKKVRNTRFINIRTVDQKLINILEFEYPLRKILLKKYLENKQNK
ncbi:MAG: hypothetical protein OIN86_04720 [Candidatus Methanoperedens sp.]|nr:hypothetical protein [Candidatus Methanoperedens sp.]CAG0996938.1 hypothetical protein METP1_02628 [Methanosarcinales archaeon]